MYKLIFVDDEAIIRRGISSQIPWEELGFQLAAVFEHGLEALDYLENNPVDLVISDINMPRMGGLELSKVLADKYPDTSVVLLTGYDEFEYAREAIRYKVKEFILKPITRRELSGVLAGIKKELDEKRAKSLQQKVLQASVEQGYPLLKDRFLYRLVTESPCPVNPADASQFWQDAQSLYQIGLVILPPSWTGLERLELREKLTGLCVGRNEVFYTPEDHVILLIQGDGDAIVNNSLEQLAGECFSFVQGKGKGMPFGGCGEIVDAPGNLKISWQGALSCGDYSRSRGLHRMVSIREIRNLKPPSREKIARYQGEILDHLKDGRPSDSLKSLAGMTGYLKNHNQGSREISLLFLQLFSRIANLVQELGMEIPADRIAPLEPASLESLIAGESLMGELIVHVSRQISTRRNHAALSRIDRAKAIIAKGYRDKNFSLQDICRELYLSTSQFSLLFKEGTGKTFVEYLTAVRMDKAKELLASTDLKSYEVADQVGFSDPRYFSICFKKHCSMTAIEYRKTRES